MVIGQCVKVGCHENCFSKTSIPTLARAVSAGGVYDCFSSARTAPELLTYRLSMSRPQSHLFEVAIEVELPESAPESLDFQKWSPGRYAVFDFAKNVQEFRGRHLSTSVPLRQGQSSSYEGE